MTDNEEGYSTLRAPDPCENHATVETKAKVIEVVEVQHLLLGGGYWKSEYWTRDGQMIGEYCPYKIQRGENLPTHLYDKSGNRYEKTGRGNEYTYYEID